MIGEAATAAADALAAR